MDFVVDLSPLKEMTTIFLDVDCLTKMAHFILCKGIPIAEQTAELTIQEVFNLFGIPYECLSAVYIRDSGRDLA